MKFNKKWNLLFIFLLVIFSNTCKNNVGLGGHIDITPPTCQLTFPTESLPIIRNSFTLKGVASDDNVVDKVKVVLKSVDRAWEGALELPCVVEKAGDGWQWSVVVNKPNEDGSFPLKDGRYNITILAYDKDGKEGKATSVLIIDNTPPVLFIQRPSSFAMLDKTNERSDDYGADLTLKGTAADDSGLSYLEFFAYGNDKWEKEIIPSSTSINVKVDGFFSSTATDKGIYRRLYGDDSNKGLKIFPCAIKVFDNAKEYESPNSNGETEKGNVSNDYYLYDVLYNIEDQKDVNVNKQLIFPKYKEQDVYDMLKGTFYLNDKGVVDTEKEAEAKRIINALKTGKFGDSNKRFKISCPNDVQGALTDENRALMGLFGLNPFKSPTFEVLGFKPCKIDFNETSFNNVYDEYTRTRGGTLSIKISPNLDESPLKDFAEFEFYYCDLNDYVQYFKDNGRLLDPYNPSGAENIMKKITGVVSKKVGSSYMVTVPVEGEVNIGHSYVILVKGRDKDENPVVIDPANIQAGQTFAYGVKIIGSGRPSDVKVTKITTYGDETHEISERVYVKYGKDVTFKFTANSENTPLKVSYTLKFGNDKKAEGEKTNINTTTINDQFIIDKSGFEKGGIYELYVEATDATAQKTTKKYTIYCDDAAPVLDIRPLEALSKTPPKIKGRLYDAGCGVEISDLKVEYTHNGGVKTAVAVQEGENKENGDWKLVDMASFPEGKYVFYFNVKDKLDNAITERTVEIHFDKTPPSLSVGTSFPNWINTRSYNVSGTASDIGGVGLKAIKCEVNGIVQALSESDNWNGVLELKEGDNTLEFFAEDKVENKSFKISKTVKVDTKAPTLKFIKPNAGEVLLASNAPIGEVEIEADDLASGVIEARYGGQNNFTSATLMTHVSGKKYKTDITSTPASDAYYFWAKDEAGNISEALSLKVKVDNEAPNIELRQLSPEVEIIETGGGKKYTNKTATITGSVSDDIGIKDIIITDENGQELKGFATGVWDFEGNKTAIFSFYFDTTQYTDNSTVKVKATAIDIAGNRKESALFDVNIKQETDIPVVTVFSFEKINETPLIRSSQLTGNVTDDDGIKAMWIQIGIDSYKPVEKHGQGIGFWTWAYNLPAGVEEGVLSLKFKVQDADNNEFEVDATEASKRVRVKGNADNDTFKDSNISFNYDRTPPEFSDNGVRFSLDATFPLPSGAITEYGKMGEQLGTNTVLGNKDKKIISIRALAKDKLGLKSATLTLGSTSQTLSKESNNLVVAREGDFDVIDFNNINISGIREGSLPLKIEVTDNSGFNQTWQTTCIVDFKEPVVELTSPIDAVYYGEVSLMGKITDEPTNTGSSVSGVDELSIQYSIGNSGFVKEHKDGSTLLSSIENTSATWTIKIPKISEYEKLDASSSPKYGAVRPTGSSRIWTIPIQIKGKDKAGNEVFSTTYDVKFDPNGEIPYIDILSPNNGAVLGGTVPLSGIARVANPASNKKVGEVYLQLSETNNFDGTQFKIGSDDYGKDGGHLIYNDSNIIYWSKSFNASDFLPTGVNSRKIYFRLRGKSEGTFGEWTAIREFTISTDVAKFLNVELVNNNTSSSEGYVANAKWIKGDDYAIKGTVTHSSGIANIDAKTGFVGSGIQALEPSSPSWFSPDKTSFNIPIRTSHYSSKYGYIEFDVEATDRRVPPNAKTVYQKILLKYDNSTPSCAIGEFIVADSAKFLNGRFTSSQTLQQGIKSSYRVLVNGKSYKIGTIATGGKEVELEAATSLSGSFDYSIVREPKIIAGSDFQIEGVAEDSGSGVQTIRIKLEVGSKSEEVSINSSEHTKVSKRRGDIVSFKTGLDTTQVDNGKGKLTITVIDEALNTVTEVLQDVIVKNSPIEITNVIFATDLSGNGSYDGDEVYDSVAKDPNVATKNGWDFNKDRDFRGKIDVSNVFTYKNKTKSYLKVLCIGGYKNLRASLYRVVDASQLSNFASLEVEDFTNLGTPIKEVTNLEAPNIAGRWMELDLNNVLSELDDGKGKFILKITDQSIGNLWYAGMKIATKVEIGDSVDPKGAIFPFFYNSNKDRLESEDEQKLSSVKYEGDEPKGHIEVGKFETNDVSSVSGKVILRGFAYDNAKIKDIRLTLPKDSKSGGTRTKDSDIKVSTYSGSGWSTGLTIKKSNFTNTGHYVEWEYEWDSNTTLCANEVEIKLEVVDAKGRNNGVTLTRPSIKQGTRVSDNDRAIKLSGGDVANKYDVVALTDKDEKIYFVSVSEMKGDKTLWNNVNVPSNIENYALYNGNVNVPSMKINVVPYINKVTTSLSSYSTATPSLYDRTASGRYPCRDDEKITVGGFNLKDADFYVGNTNLGSQTILNMATAKSGALEARVSYIDNSETKVVKSLNNTDDNDRAYNKCPNKINNDLLNNDVFIDVWGFKYGAYPSDGAITYPVMKVSPKDGKVGLAFANGVTLFNMPGYDSSNSNWRSARRFDKNWAQYVFTDFAFDDNDYSYGMATGVDMNKGDSNGVASYSKFVARRAGEIDKYNNYGNSNGTKKGWGQRLENIGTTDNPYTADPDRIQSPSIATVTSSGGTTYVYLAYYDAINKHIRYRWGTVSHGNNSNGPTYGGQLNDLTGYGRMQEPDKKYYSILAGPETKKGATHIPNLQGSTGVDKAGKYVSIGAIKNGSTDVVVALWYNFQARSLMYAYCDNPTNSDEYNDVEWKGVTTVDVGGEYVKCAVDRDKGIHVAYYSNGDLKYAYLSSYTSGNWQVATVDSYSLAGTHVSIDLAKDPSTRKWVPYIGYYMPGNANARIAYLVGGIDSNVPNGAENEKYTGKWEISIVPTKHVVREYRISVGVWGDPNNGYALTAIPVAQIPSDEWGHNGNKWTSWKGVQPYGKEGESIVGGNGTTNPILGYAVEEEGAFELAQKK